MLIPPSCSLEGRGGGVGERREAEQIGENPTVTASHSDILLSTRQTETPWGIVGCRHVSGSSSLVVTKINQRPMP